MITLYDFDSKLAEKAYNPNTFKTRISLNYKGLRYKTEWIEYPNIEPTMKKNRGPADREETRCVGMSDLYTLPAIRDSTTGKVIADSTAIAVYLDETYPDTLRLFPALSTGGSTQAAVTTLESVWMAAINTLFPIMFPAVSNILNPVSEAYFRSTREQEFGKKLEDFAPPGPIRTGLWTAAKDALHKITMIYDANGEGKQFFFGDTFSFADAIVIGFLRGMKTALVEEEWKEFATWNNGRWGILLESTKYLQTVK